MADGYEDLREDDLPGPAYEGYESAELACPAERSGHVAVSDGRHMFVWGGYKSNQVRGLYDFYLPREELWIYNMETGRWKKINTEGDVPPSMSGSCAVCVDRVLYLFGGHHSRGNTNKFYMLDSRSTDRVLHWERIDCQGIPPSSKDKLGVWVYKNKLIFFGGYGYLPEDKVLGTFEFDETSFWNSSHPRGWNDHVHILDTETFVWSQPITTGKAPSPRAAHACATVGNKGFVFGGRYRDARMNDLHYLNLDTWEWNELIPQGICPVGRSWHSLTPVSSDHLFLFGGFTTDKQPLSDAWTYCISKNEWIQFNHPYTEKPRLWHTACASDEGEVIVFGGCANNLLVHHRAAHSNEILIFSVQPKSLVRLSLEAVICFKEMLASSWNCLPKHLLHSVNQRFGSNNTSGS
ncbi:kelch domain-containing protein 2 isoform 3-T3 [Megaptera novaeangliae]